MTQSKRKFKKVKFKKVTEWEYTSGYYLLGLAFVLFIIGSIFLVVMIFFNLRFDKFDNVDEGFLFFGASLISMSVILLLIPVRRKTHWEEIE